MRIEKERNLYKFYIEGKDKPYVLDVNTATVYGLRGNPIGSVPTAIRNYGEYHYDHYPLYIWWWTKYYNITPSNTAKMLLLADRLQNALPNITPNNLRGIVSGRTLNRSIDALEKGFTSFVQYIQNGGNDFDDWLEDATRERVKREFHLPEDTPNHIVDAIVYDPSVSRKPYAVYYITHGLGEWFGWNRYDIHRRLQSFYQYCDELHIQPQKSDFFKQYIAVKKNWDMNKVAIEKAKLERNQLAHKTALEFETDDLMVIIPTTREEFKFEGDSQHNCVYTQYLSACIDGRTNVVFIRKKSDPSRSYITCEVRKGEIYQYYYARNQYVHNESDLAFKAAYETHIRNNWGE